MKYHSSYFTVDEVSSITLKKFMTKCDRIITNCDSLVYYKVDGQLLQIATAFLLQSATRFITNCDRHYKLSAMIITNCDS